MIDLFIEDNNGYIDLISKEFNDIFNNNYNVLYPILSDYVYVKYYLNDPVFYMIFLTERDDHRDDNGLFYLPKYVDKNSKEFKDADLYFSKCDLRVTSQRLKWCLNEIFSGDFKCNEKNIQSCISKCLWSINLNNEQIIKIYIDSMFRHRKIILNYIIKYVPELYKFLLRRSKPEDMIYNNNLFLNLNLGLMLDDANSIKEIYKKFHCLCDRFKESIFQMRKEYIQLFNMICIKGYFMLSNEISNDIDEIRLYGILNKSSSDNYVYESDPFSSNCYDYIENINNLWRFYHNWNPYCGKISDLISIKKLSEFKRFSTKFIEFVRRHNKNNSLFILANSKYAIKLKQNDYYNLHQMSWYNFDDRNSPYNYLKNLLNLDDSLNVQTHILNLLLKVIECTVCNTYHFNAIKFYAINKYTSFNNDNQQITLLKDTTNKFNLIDLFIPYKFKGYDVDIMQSKCSIEFNLYKKYNDYLYTFYVKVSFNLKGEIIDYLIIKKNKFDINNDYNTDVLNCIKGIIDKVLEFRLNINHIYQDYIDSEINIKYNGNFEQFLTEFKFHMLDTFKNLNDIQLVNTISKDDINEPLDIQELISEINALRMRWNYNDF